MELSDVLKAVVEQYKAERFGDADKSARIAELEAEIARLKEEQGKIGDINQDMTTMIQGLLDVFGQTLPEGLLRHALEAKFGVPEKQGKSGKLVTPIMPSGEGQQEAAPKRTRRKASDSPDTEIVLSVLTSEPMYVGEVTNAIHKIGKHGPEDWDNKRTAVALVELIKDAKACAEGERRSKKYYLAG